MSERDGFMHVYRYDKNGKLLNQVTKGNWVTLEIIGLDNTGKKLLVKGTDESGLNQYAYSANLYAQPTTEILKIKSPGGMMMNARMIKPSHFSADKKYPVVVYVYGGPHAQMVTNSWGAGAPLWMHYLAEKGYLVFTVDNRGSANRGFEFENTIHRRLGTPEMEDQLAGVEYLKSLPYADTDRMAVHGWSYGGYMTTSLMLRHPGVFKVGVAGDSRYGR